MTKTEIEDATRKIVEFIKKWNEMGSVFSRCAKSGDITKDDSYEFRKQLDELNFMYPKIANLVSRYVRSEYYDPALGIHIKDYSPIIDILVNTSSLTSVIEGSIGILNPISIEEFERKWHTSRSLLISLLGFVKTSLENIGKVTLEEYLRLKDIETKFERLRSIDDLSSFIKSIEFLRLGTEWSLATIALQIQEIATIKIADRLNIKLDKANVESILGIQINDKDFGFSKQYEALSKRVEEIKNVKLPNLTTALRSTRVDILHRGYNPQPEEVNAIVEFTKGFLDRLRTLY